MQRNVDLPIRKGINSLSRDAGLCSPVLQGSSPGAAMPAGRSSDEVSQKSARFCWDISPDVFVAERETSQTNSPAQLNHNTLLLLLLLPVLARIFLKHRLF